MEDSLDAGWEPPPLLAEFQTGRLLLQDGNHRYEALVRAGEAEAWVLVWFDDERTRDRRARTGGEARPTASVTTPVATNNQPLRWSTANQWTSFSDLTSSTIAAPA